MDNGEFLIQTYMAIYKRIYPGYSDAATDLLFTEIMRQKWIALYFQIESYNDWRRTNKCYWIDSQPEGSKIEIPRRYPYSVDEVTYNSNTPVVADIWQRVWWDLAKNNLVEY